MKVNIFNKSNLKSLITSVVLFISGSMLISSLTCNYRKISYDLMKDNSINSFKLETNTLIIDDIIKNNFEEKYNTNIDKFFYTSVSNFYNKESNNPLGLCYLNNDRINELGFKIEVGTYPIKNDEILITDFEYYLINAFGFKNINGEKEIIKSNKDIINKNIKINGDCFKIIGILNTTKNIDISKFDSIINEKNIKDSKFKYDYFDSFINNYSNLIYISSSKEEIENKKSNNGGYLMTSTNYDYFNEIILKSLKLNRNYNELFLSTCAINQIRNVKNIMLYTNIILSIVLCVTLILYVIFRSKYLKEYFDNKENELNFKNTIFIETLLNLLFSSILILLLDLIFYINKNLIFYLFHINIIVILFIILLEMLLNSTIYLVIFNKNKGKTLE